MVSNNWLLNNGMPMDARLAFLCSETPILHLLSAARDRGSIQGKQSTQVGTASPGYLPQTRL
ncbi:hypothetical protein HNQ39_002009 [Armatimonas rosea]|uniref:Uncharacterized protein n=1 Tax=Armatimonas rosea TaxID=685828 RepID=A0A7W9SQK8_ARMRO|nr:hypothetical protein [Armatimonas rosea]